MALFGSTPERKLGRNPSNPRDLERRLRLKHFLQASYLGTVPDTVSYLPPTADLPIDANDSLGNCTAAAAAHVETTFSAFGQKLRMVPSVADVIAFYSGSTGYVPGRPSTDQGGDMLTVQKYWQNVGLAGHKLAAYFAVDPSDFEEMRAALYLFGNLYIGFYLPQSAMDTVNQGGTVWDVSRRNSQIIGGHAVAVHKIVKGGNITVSTWGQLQEMTPAFWLRYVDEPYSTVSQTWVKNNATPSGLDVDAANAAFLTITGRPGPFLSDGPVDPTPPIPVPLPDDVDAALATELRVWLAAKDL